MQEEDRVFYRCCLWTPDFRANFSSQQSGHQWNVLSTQLPQEQIHWSLSVSTNMISSPLSLKILNNMLYYWNEFVHPEPPCLGVYVLSWNNTYHNVVVIATKKLGINPYFHKKVKSVNFPKRKRRKTSHSTTMWYDGLKAGCFMNCCRETVEMAVIPDNRRELDPRRTWPVRRRIRHPRTPGRTVRYTVAAGNSWNIRL